MKLFDAEALTAHAEWAGLPQETWQELLGLVSGLNDDHRRAVESIYSLLYEANEADFPKAIACVPEGEAGLVTNLLVALGGVPGALAIHQRLGLPEAVTRDTIGDISIWVAACKQQFGVPGIRTTELRWTHHYLTGGLFRVGRLQFRHLEASAFTHGFRHRDSGRTVAVCRDGESFTEDGLRADMEGRVAKWESTFSTEDDGWKGNMSNALGFAQRVVTFFSQSEWEHVLSPDDAMLDVHIPAGGGLTRENLTASFEQAESFFDRYFPERSFKGFTCRAWLLDGQLRQFLKPTSNIIGFQEQFVLRPTLGGDKASIERIFGEEYHDVPADSLPRNSSLQCQVADFMMNGGRLKMGAGFRLKRRA